MGIRKGVLIMGRTVKRVPLDFDWPINKTWYGYLINKCVEDSCCEDCIHFARLKNIPLTSYKCPFIEALEPPTGPGYQLWENTSEGSPMSPVFETKEQLALWCEHNATIFGSHTMTYKEWLDFIIRAGC